MSAIKLLTTTLTPVPSTLAEVFRYRDDFQLVERIENDTVVLVETFPGPIDQQLANEIASKGCPIIAFFNHHAAGIEEWLRNQNLVYSFNSWGIGAVAQISYALASQSWRFLDGWFDFADFYLTLLRKHLSVGGTFVEVGTWMGRSLGFMAAAKDLLSKPVALIGVDDFKGGTELVTQVQSEYQGDFYRQFMRNMIVGGYARHICPISLPSVEAAKLFPDNSLDAVFIDACHEYDFVKADIAAWTPKVKHLGVIAGHDWDAATVHAAVQEAFGEPESFGNVWKVLKRDRC